MSFKKTDTLNLTTVHEWPEPALDEDDVYPTEAAIEFIEKYPTTGSLLDLFAFIESIWWQSEMLWHEQEMFDVDTKRHVKQYHISTGGWSGNEDIIRALQMTKYNYIWICTWVQSRRGGHYIFEVDLEQADRNFQF